MRAVYVDSVCLAVLYHQSSALGCRKEQLTLFSGVHVCSTISVNVVELLGLCSYSSISVPVLYYSVIDHECSKLKCCKINLLEMLLPPYCCRTSPVLHQLSVHVTFFSYESQTGYAGRVE